MNIKIYFDFHDIFVDSKSARIKSFKILSWNDSVEVDYNNGTSKKEICKKYDISYKRAEILYRKLLTKNKENIDFAKKLSESYPVALLSMSRKERLFKDLNKFKLKSIFKEIISKEDISTKNEFLTEESKRCDWVVYFNHEIKVVKVEWNVVYLPINLRWDLSMFKNMSFTEHAKNKLLYNELSWYYMDSIANDTEEEVDFLIKVYNNNNLKIPGNVLDCCCWVWRHDFLLWKKWFQVTGIDISKNQIDTAKLIHNNGNVNYEVMDVRNIQLPYKEYDMSICMRTTYNYLSKDYDLKKFIKSNYKHQHKWSILVLDSKNIPSLDKRRVYKRMSTSKDWTKIELIINKYIINNIQNSQYLYFIKQSNWLKKFYYDDEFVRFYKIKEIENIIKWYYKISNIYWGFDWSKYLQKESNRFILILKRL